MTHSYSIESVQACLERLGLPFSEYFARALVALLTAHKISLHQVAQLMPGEQNLEANRQQLRRCLDHETLTAEIWARDFRFIAARTLATGAGTRQYSSPCAEALPPHPRVRLAEWYQKSMPVVAMIR